MTLVIDLRNVVRNAIYCCMIVAIFCFGAGEGLSQLSNETKHSDLVPNLREVVTKYWIPQRDALLQGTTIRDLSSIDADYIASIKEGYSIAEFTMDDGERFIFCLNPQYAFRLSKASGSNNWIFREAYEDFDLLPRGNIVKQVIPQIQYWATAPFHILLRDEYGEPMSLLTLLDNPAFRITGAKHSLQNDVATIEYSFEYDITSEVDQSPSKTVGTFSIDPNKKWALVAFDWTATGPRFGSTIKKKGQYDDFVRFRGGLIPRKHIVNDGSSQHTRIYDYAPSFEKDRCFLTHYGFPEPDWYRPSPPYWLYISIAGMVLVFIGALLLRYGRNLWRRG